MKLSAAKAKPEPGNPEPGTRLHDSLTLMNLQGNGRHAWHAMTWSTGRKFNRAWKDITAGLTMGWHSSGSQ